VHFQTQEAAGFAELRTGAGEPVGSYEDSVVGMYRVHPSEVKTYNIADGPVPVLSQEDLDRIDFAYASGSYHMPDSGDEVVQRTQQALDMLVQGGVPTDATCFSHQVYEVGYGGEIAASDEISFGVYTMYKSRTRDAAKDPVMSRMPDAFPVFKSNYKYVTELAHDTPAGSAVVLATSEFPNEMVRRGATLYKKQVHTDLTPDVVDALAHGKLRDGAFRVDGRTLTSPEDPVFQDKLVDLRRDGRLAMKTSRLYAGILLEQFAVPRRKARAGV
jgi:GMP synthase-like glutamine amidotransferase